MNRRDFLLAAGVAAGGTAASGAAAAQQGNASGGNQTGGGNATGGNATGGNMTGSNATANATGNATGNASGGNQSAAGGGGGPTKAIAVGPSGSLVFDPDSLTISPGTTVKWTWESDMHNIVPSSKPSGSSWKGTPGPPSKTYDTGYTYSHTFSTTGTYDYYCDPHRSAGMKGSITVKQGGASSGGGESEPSPEEMGVPFQAHFVGIATILMMVVSLIYSFFTVKYGESPNAKGGNN